MAENSDVNPIAENEVLYRRIPEVWCGTNQLVLEAFLPTKSDTDGLSLARECVGAVGAAATGRQGKQFYVGELRPTDLPQGLSIIADANEHAFIPEMNHAARQSDVKETREQLRQWAEILRQRCKNVLGPFPGKAAIMKT